MKVDAWQLVLVCWGTKYGVDDINRAHRAAMRTSERHARTVVITDRERPGLDDGIRAVSFPEPFLQEVFRGPGCQAKLSIFADGVVPDDMLAVFTDLDSLILGDLALVLEDHRREDQFSILQSTGIPATALTRAIHRASNHRVYARGNSSIVAYHPRHMADVADRFLARHARDGLDFKPTWADERWMSWVAQDRLRFADRRKAVKFTREFMARDIEALRRRAASGAVQARREGLLFLTLNQDVLKPDQLLAAKDNDVITDRKGRKTEWSDAVLGKFHTIIPAYFS